MASAISPAVELQNVTKSFGGRRVLDDVSLTVPAGRSLGILGRSGTGKSVTLRHMIGLVTPDEGRVIVEGHDLATLRPAELAKVRQRIGFLFQGAALFDSISVGENVAFPLQRHTKLKAAAIRDRARELLREVGLEDEYDTMPAQLSGGMRKRAGLARAMALEPSILLVDEPSAGLDPITSASIDRLLLALQCQSGTTLVVVTHNIPSARTIADELVFLHAGRVIARGSAAELGRHDDPLVREFMGAKGTG
jgi:phospholipid/cholesterol/gamma-HCH transport system ATP-binding protein